MKWSRRAEPNVCDVDGRFECIHKGAGGQMSQRVKGMGVMLYVWDSVTEQWL